MAEAVRQEAVQTEVAQEGAEQKEAQTRVVLIKIKANGEENNVFFKAGYSV